MDGWRASDRMGAFGHPTIEALEGARGAARVAAAWQLAAHAPRAAWPGEHPDGHRQIYVERPHSPLDMGTRRGVDGGDDGGVDGRAAAEAALREAFAFFDRSGRGRLTPDDLWTGMRALGYQLSMDEAWQIFEGVALPHSREAGTIGVGEFRQLLRGSVGAMGGQTGGFGAMSSPTSCSSTRQTSSHGSTRTTTRTMMAWRGATKMHVITTRISSSSLTARAATWRRAVGRATTRAASDARPTRPRAS